MASVRQTMRNLLAAGLYHLAEQQLANACRDASFNVKPPGDTKLSVVAKWYRKYFELDLEALRSWKLIDELRNVANAVKHAEGDSTGKLRTLRPELFRNPDYAELHADLDIADLAPMNDVLGPLAGEDLFVSEKLLKMYLEGTVSFFIEVAEHFKSKAGEYYPSVEDPG